MPGLPLHSYIDREISVKTLTVTVCCCQSDGMLKAISNALISMVSESLAKASKMLYKDRRGFRECSNRI